jgi:hypothetical protein
MAAHRLGGGAHLHPLMFQRWMPGNVVCDTEKSLSSPLCRPGGDGYVVAGWPHEGIVRRGGVQYLAVT